MGPRLKLMGTYPVRGPLSGEILLTAMRSAGTKTIEVPRRLRDEWLPVVYRGVAGPQRNIMVALVAMDLTAYFPRNRPSPRSRRHPPGRGVGRSAPGPRW